MLCGNHWTTRHYIEGWVSRCYQFLQHFILKQQWILISKTYSELEHPIGTLSIDNLGFSVSSLLSFIQKPVRMYTTKNQWLNKKVAYLKVDGVGLVKIKQQLLQSTMVSCTLRLTNTPQSFYKKNNQALKGHFSWSINCFVFFCKHCIYYSSEI